MYDSSPEHFQLVHSFTSTRRRKLLLTLNVIVSAMQLRPGIIFFSFAVIAVIWGEPIFDKLHPNRDERFQIKSAGEWTRVIPGHLNPGQIGMRVEKCVVVLQFSQFAC